ncbi:MAG: RDD family protein [Acidobacteria bacterium]|nr:MAG: RDD family protein [Acidobacteriota bacterium]
MRNRDALVIRTPEGIEFSLPLAGPFSRMLALVIDIAVIIMLGSFLEKVLAPLLVFGQDLADALAVIGYFVISDLQRWRWRGQTVGKRLLRLRVVDARGLRLEPSQVVVRNLMRFVDALPLLYLVGGVACVLSRYRQRLGDLAAGTVVVRTPKLVRPDLDQILGSKYNSLAEDRRLAARLRQKTSPAIARVALEALLRRDQLEPGARLQVFNELAAHFRTLAPYPPDAIEQLSDEQYVRNVVEVLYRPADRSAQVSVLASGS